MSGPVNTISGCPLCDAAGGPVVFKGEKFRLIRAEELGFPAFYRLVWNDHVAEFSDLSAVDRTLCMEAVVRVERVLRAQLRPGKINLAALGNQVPHLHWHIIARYDRDSHFPAPVWTAPQRETPPDLVAGVLALRPALEKILMDELAGLD